MGLRVDSRVTEMMKKSITPKEIQEFYNSVGAEEFGRVVIGCSIDDCLNSENRLIKGFDGKFRCFNFSDENKPKYLKINDEYEFYAENVAFKKKWLKNRPLITKSRIMIDRLRIKIDKPVIGFHILTENNENKRIDKDYVEKLIEQLFLIYLKSKKTRQSMDKNYKIIKYFVNIDNKKIIDKILSKIE